MKLNPELLRGALEPVILEVIADGATYGYEIARAIEQTSGGHLLAQEGTLYPALHGLENKGLIESYTQEENGRTRCYYKLTKKGTKALAEQREEWTRFSGAFSLALQES